MRLCDPKKMVKNHSIEQIHILRFRTSFGQKWPKRDEEKPGKGKLLLTLLLERGVAWRGVAWRGRDRRAHVEELPSFVLIGIFFRLCTPPQTRDHLLPVQLVTLPLSRRSGVQVILSPTTTSKSLTDDDAVGHYQMLSLPT